MFQAESQKVDPKLFEILLQKKKNKNNKKAQQIRTTIRLPPPLASRCCLLGWHKFTMSHSLVEIDLFYNDLCVCILRIFFFEARNFSGKVNPRWCVCVRQEEGRLLRCLPSMVRKTDLTARVERYFSCQLNRSVGISELNQIRAGY